MQWSDLQFRPPERTLRQFAGLCLACFGALAVWEYLIRGRATMATVFAVLALTIGSLGLIKPQSVRPIYVGWIILAFPIGWTVSQGILALLFYGLFTPLGLLFRVIGRDPLHRTRRPELATYWTPKVTPSDPRRYFKQF